MILCSYSYLTDNNSIEHELVILNSLNDIYKQHNNIISIKSKNLKIKSPIATFSLPFFKHLYQLVINKYTLLDALKIVQNCFSDTKAVIVKFFINQIMQGHALSECLGLFPEYFDQIIIEIIKTAEQSGNLSKSLKNIIQYLNSQLEISNKIKEAIKYPITVLVIVNIILFFWLIVIVPHFKTIFDDLNIQTSFLTNFIIFLSDGLINYNIIVLFILGLMIVLLFLFKHKIKSIIFKIPLIKYISTNIIKLKFSESMALMIEEKIDIIDALTCICSIEKFQIYEKIIEFINMGKTLTASLLLTKQFSSYEASIIKIGEKSNTLHTAFNSIKDILSLKISDKFNKIIALLPIILICFVGLLIVILAYATFAPLYSNLGNFC